MRRPAAPTFGAVALILLLVLVGVLVREHDQESVANQRDLCVEVQALKLQIDLTLIRQKKALPKNDYYRQHPDELANAMREIRRSIKDFKPHPCP